MTSRGAEVVRVRVWRWLAATGPWMAVWSGVWLLAVVLVAGVAWFAIDSAGREVAGADEVVTLVDAAQRSPAPGTGSTTLAGTPAGTPPAGVAATPLSSSVTSSVTSSVPGPGAPSVPGPGGGRTGSYSSAGGDLVIRCGGEEVSGWAMRPADGWRVEAAPAAAGALRVLFVAAEGRIVGVQAACPHGQPSFSPTSSTPRN